MLLSSKTKLTPFQLKNLNREKWESIHGKRSHLTPVVVSEFKGLERGVMARGESAKSCTTWSKHRKGGGVLPRALRKARSHKFI